MVCSSHLELTVPLYNGKSEVLEYSSLTVE